MGIRVSSVQETVEAARKAGTFCVDLETSGTDRSARIYSVSVAVPGAAHWLPLRGGRALPYAETLRALHDGIFSRPDLTMIAHNWKADAAWIEQSVGKPVACVPRCPLVAAWLLDEEATIKDGLSLYALAKRWLGKRMREYSEFEAGQQLFRAKTPLEEKGFSDARVTFALWCVIEEDLKKDPKLWKWFVEVEMEVVRVIMEMEETGFVADTAWLTDESRRLEREVMAAMLAVRDVAGHAINVGSPEQVSKFLFVEVGLKPKPFMERDPAEWALAKRGPGGETLWRTSEDVLAEYRGEHPAADAVLEFRRLEKEKGTYVDAILARAMEDPENKVRTDFKQARMVTGRISSSDPNFQSLPKRLRRMFVAGPGEVIVAADFNQVELRVMAHVSGDVALRRAYVEGLDLHAMTQEALGLEQRRVAKVINFGIPFGLTAISLQQKLFVEEGIRETPDNCERWIEGMFKKYPRVKAFMERTGRQAEKFGHVKTLFGRYRRLADSFKRDRGHALRQAFNAPVQGSAADICKIAMRNTRRGVLERVASDPRWASFRQACQVHDQIVAKAPAEIGEEALRFLVGRMEGAVKLDVPLVAEAGIGRNWAEAEADADARKKARKTPR